jgi:hypothetical protein
MSSTKSPMPLVQKPEIGAGGLLILTLIELNFHDQGEIMDALAYEFYSIKSWESCARVALERAALTLDPEMAGGLYALAGTALFQLDSVQPGSRSLRKSLGPRP